MLFRTLPRHCSVVLRQVLVSLFENCPQYLPSAYFSEPCLLPILKQSFPPCCVSVPPPSTEPWPMCHHPILLSAAFSIALCIANSDDLFMSTYINNNNRTQQPHISIEQLQPNQALPCYCTAIAIADCQLLAAAAGGWWLMDGPGEQIHPHPKPNLQVYLWMHLDHDKKHPGYHKKGAPLFGYAGIIQKAPGFSQIYLGPDWKYLGKRFFPGVFIYASGNLKFTCVFRMRPELSI